MLGGGETLSACLEEDPAGFGSVWQAGVGQARCFHLRVLLNNGGGSWSADQGGAAREGVWAECGVQYKSGLGILGWSSYQPFK